MTIFDDMAAALAPYVGSEEAGGFILGFTTIVVFMIGFTLALGRDALKGIIPLVLVIVSVIFVTLIGWFPLWVPFVLVLILAFMFWMKGADIV